MAKTNGTLDVSALESWLWEAACTIRGPLDAPKFKDYILPLIFLKRLSDVFDDEIAHLAHEFGDETTAAKLVEQDHKLVRFYVPQTAAGPPIARRPPAWASTSPTPCGPWPGENPRLSGVIDVTDFNATAAGQRIVDDGRLAALVQVLSNPTTASASTTSSRTSWAAPTSTCCASSPRARARAPASSTRRARSPS